MASIQATRIKKGMLIKMDQDLFRVLDLQHVTPGNLRGFVRIKLRNIRNGTLSDQKLRSEDTIERATLDERQMQYLYQDGDDYYFMDTESFEQVHISSEALGDSVNYMKAEMTISVEFYGSEPVGIELPPTVDLKVTDTAPGIKGATASAQVKPATLETGLVVQVPPFVNPGDSVRVSTDTGEYLSRAT
jgi:elongation factor P